MVAYRASALPINAKTPAKHVMFQITHVFKGVAQKASKWLPLVLIAALAAMSQTGKAQTLKIRFPFDDSPGGTTTPSDTSGGGVAVTLNMLNGAGVATDFHGAAGSGVSGASRALDFHSAPSQPPQAGSVAAPIALVTGSAALGLGTVT